MIPTAAQFVGYARSLESSPVRGRIAENVNPETEEFYGNETPASWCLIHEWYCLRHFGTDAANLIKKDAWVPDLEGMNGHNGARWFPKSHAREAQEGDLIAYDFNHNGEPEHTGIFVKGRDSSTFYATEGNTGGDDVAYRVRYYSDVYGFLRLNFAAPDPSAYPGVLYRYIQGKPMIFSSHVAWIQERLQKYGYKITADGVYGPITAKTVEEFQKSHSLQTDGIVGPKTWVVLRRNP